MAPEDDDCTPYELAERKAQTGARFLDEIEPQWFHAVNVDKLDESFVWGDVCHWVFGLEAAARHLHCGFDVLKVDHESRAREFLNRDDEFGADENPFEAMGFDQSVEMENGYFVTYRNLSRAWRVQVDTRMYAQ